MNDPRDQYTVDMDARYPEYSDMDAAQYHASMVNYKPMRNHEDMYLNTHAWGRPSYYPPCECGACPMKNIMAPKPRSPMRKKTVEERQRDMPSLTKKCNKSAAETMWGDITGFIGGTGENKEGEVAGGYDTTTIFIIFLLVIIVCLCYSYSAAIGRIDAQMKILTQLLKK